MSKYIFRREIKVSFPTAKRPSEHRRKNLKPFISLFNKREKERLVRKLFRDDLAQFNAFIQVLDTKMTWHEVFQSIESEMHAREIDMDLEEARQLTDRIYLIFFPDDISIGA